MAHKHSTRASRAWVVVELEGEVGNMSGQIHKPVFGVTAKEKLTLTSADSDSVDHSAKALNILTQSAQSIGDFAYALLMITIVGAHPVWVALLIMLVFST